MTSKLRYLYERLIENREHEYRGGHGGFEEWHERYCRLYNETAKIRQQIKEGRSLSPENDYDFLKRLLYEKYNGISSGGQSVLSHDNFLSFINNKEFISALEHLILTPDREHYKKFESAWIDHSNAIKSVRINWLRIYRVVATCTLDVSSTVNYYKFNKLFYWLIDYGVIPKYSGQNCWFEKNAFLMNILKEEFKDKLKENKTDEFYLSQFVWILYEYYNAPTFAFEEVERKCNGG